MLNRETMRGPWAGLPIAWNDDDSFDERTYREDIARCCAAGVPGVYTGGATGEFYGLEYEEFVDVTRVTVEECRNAGTPVMIGCTSTCTRGVIRRARYAMEAGADAIQIALPFWMEVPDSEVVRFFKDVSQAVPGMPITIYETLRAKKAIPLHIHREIHEAVPAVIGMKSNEGTVGCTKEGCRELSEMFAIFVGEDEMYELGPYGATGSCSSFVYMNPRMVLKAFDLMLTKEWETLKPFVDMFRRIAYEGLLPCFQAGRADSAVDRLLGRSTGFLNVSLRCRAPYPRCTEEMLDGFRAWLRDNCPEVLDL